MNKIFWNRLAVWVAIVTALGIYRVSKNKIKEQKTITELQLHQLPAYTSLFQRIYTDKTIFIPVSHALFHITGLIITWKILVPNMMDMAPGDVIALRGRLTVKEPRPLSSAVSPVDASVFSSCILFLKGIY